MKMNSKVLAGAVFAMALAATAPAQAQVYGIKGDLNYTGSSASGYGYGLGFGAGGSMLMNMEPVGVEVDLLFNRRKITAADGDVEFTQNSLDLPVQAVFGLGPVMLTAGGYLSYALGDTSISAPAAYGLADSAEPTTSLDFGLVVGVGGMFEGVSVEGRFLLGLVDLGEDQAGNSVDSKTRAFDLLVGYYF